MQVEKLDVPSALETTSHHLIITTIMKIIKHILVYLSYHMNIGSLGFVWRQKHNDLHFYFSKNKKNQYQKIRNITNLNIQYSLNVLSPGG